MTKSLQGTGLDLTPDIRRQVDAMIDAVLQPLGAADPPVVQVAVEIERAPTLYRAEATFTLNRSTLRAEATADTVHESLTDVRHMLTRQVSEWSTRRRDAERVGTPEAWVEDGADGRLYPDDIT